MHTIQLRIKDQIYQKVLKKLGEFSADEVEILDNTSAFETNQQYLLQELNEINEGKAAFLTQEAFEKRLSSHGR